MTSRVGLKSNNGFTLLELLIALAIIGLILSLVVGRVGKLLEREMKQSASRFASTLRYLYNKSVSEGVTLRLVLDIEESRYWVEGTTETFTLTREEEEERKTENGKQRTETETENGEPTEEAPSIQPKEATFSPQESYLLKPVSLPKGVYFKDVYAEHQIERLDKGRAFIYFFPRGYVERSVIHLRDAKDEVHYTLEVNPITGRVKIERGYKELEIER